MTKSNTSVHDVADAICSYYRIDIDDLRSLKREADIVKARALSSYICRRKTTASYTDIGNYINRDHATIIHHNKKMEYMTKDETEDYFNILQLIDPHVKNPILASMTALGRYFYIIRNTEFAIWN